MWEEPYCRAAVGSLYGDNATSMLSAHIWFGCLAGLCQSHGGLPARPSLQVRTRKLRVAMLSFELAGS